MLIIITSNHIWHDTRIFLKYFKSSKINYETSYFYVGNQEAKVERCYNFNNSFRLFLKLLSKKHHILHFHDPGFIVYGYLLKILTNNKIIYDIHEDVPSDILQKTWILKPLRIFYSNTYRYLEKHIGSKFHGLITVTDHILDRIIQINPNSITVKNYPILPMQINEWALRKNQIVYIGAISEQRGIYQILDLADQLKNYSIIIAGKFATKQLEKSVKSHPGWNRIEYRGVVNGKERDTLLNESKIGLVLLKNTETYKHALPVKLFEYISFGLPVICSNISIQEDIIIRNNCGISLDTSAIDQKININELNEFLSNENELERIHNNAILTSQKFNWDNEYLRYKNFLNRIECAE